MRILLLPIAVTLGLLLGGCQMNLYSGLNEKDATQMMALLMEQGLACDKVKSKEGWDLVVGKSDLPVAVRVLSREGFPRNEYQSVGDVFGNKGLISSPQEDRIRYIYALSQEIAESISEIDGVLSSRVHLVLPENDPLSDSLKPSSASVFVKYLPTSSVRQNVTQIKHLVLNGVEGLAIEKVSVVTVPGEEVKALPVPTMNIMGVRLFKDSAKPLLWILLAGIPLLLVFGYFAGMLVVRKRPMAMIRKQPPAGGLASL